jgi:hypothetical protein
MTEETKSISRNAQNVATITDPVEVQLALNGLLTVNGHRVLVTRGNDAMVTVGQVYTEFVKHTDQNGQPFRFSRERRSLVETEPIFKAVVRVTPAKMAEYIRKWFQLAELVQATSGRVLILTKELPKMITHLWAQGRFVANVAPMFEFID